jgi:mannosyltransferase OCH1-like enzyme
LSIDGVEMIDQWRFDGYSLYFHDDVAVDRLLAKYWPEFPQLQLMQQCSISGAAKADIWRLLVLWEYGGIYTGE